ncbi:MAG: hypothetical protein F6K19_08850 [Cyanothece sp. SIO1E1]|nr:hypothetical protein [Cyanothece sp. SIO1E1]
MKKEDELRKFRDLNLATLDYLHELSDLNFDIPETDSTYYEHMKVLVQDCFESGSLTKLKNWFDDLSETPREVLDLSFNDYIQEKTGYEVNIHKKFEMRISEILQRNRIKSNQEYRDVETKVNYLSELENGDEVLINELNELLLSYYRRKIR